MSDNDTAYSLVLSFDGLPFAPDPEHAFTHGVEFGMLWSRMKGGQEAEIAQCFSSANRVVIERAAAAEGWSVETKSTEYPEWIDVRLTKTAPAKLNPHGLRVVGKQ